MAKKTSPVRTRILENSLYLFGQRGYFDTTTKEIAEKSEVNETTVFYHFSGKPTLYQEVIREYADTPLPQLEDVQQKLTYSDLKQDLYALALAYLEATFSRIYVLRMFISRIPGTPQTDHEEYLLLPEVVEHFTRYLTELERRGMIKNGERTIEVEFFVSHVTRLALDVTAHENRFAYTDAVKDELVPKMKELAAYFTENVLIPTPTA